MIDYIKGDIVELGPAAATIENHGIGFFIHISLNTYSALNGQKNAKLYIYEAIREDAYQLFGFFEKKERDLFILLISVSGIGAGTARMILSSMTPNELETVIASGNADMLKTVKGIGMKTAQRVILDLKDKIRIDTNVIEQTSLLNSELAGEAVSALVMLGFPQVASQKAVAKILKDNPGYTIEEVLKIALKIL